MRFAKKLPADTSKHRVLGVGVVCKTFDPVKGTVSDILAATSGGVTISVEPEFVDDGEDIDNCPKGTKELKRKIGENVKAEGDFVAMTAETAATLCAGADVSEGGHVTPRANLKPTDFIDLWIVADYSDENGDTNGGMCAFHIKNALSVGGFQMKTTDKEKGKFSFEFMGHYSLENIDEVPYEIYIKEGTPEGGVSA